MHEHLNYLKFSGVVSTCPDSTGKGARKGKGRVERRRGVGKEKVEGMTEERGGRKAWGIRMARGLRHCS